MQRLVRTLTFLYTALFALLLAAAAVGSVFLTVRFERNIENDRPIYLPQNIPVTVLLAAAILVVLSLVVKRTRISSKHLTAAALVISLLLCLLFVGIVRGQPTNDAAILDGIMRRFMAGDLSALTEESYLWIYPFQITYVFFGQILTALFGAGNYLPYQVLNVLSILLTIYFMQKITREIFHDEEICRIEAVLSAGLLFLFVYASFIYNDIWSFAPAAVGLYCLIRFLKEGRFSFGIWGAVLTALAVLIKSNVYIAVVAAEILLLLSAAEDAAATETASETSRRRGITQKVIVMLLFLLLARGFTGAVEKGYAQAAGLDALPAGTTTRAYLAMGMREGDNTYGWYNGFNAEVIRESGYDTARADAAAEEEIRARLSYFGEHPKYPVKFYLYKYLSQWADPTCISLREYELTGRHAPFRTGAYDSVVFGAAGELLWQLMNAFHLLLFITSCFFIWTWILRKKDPGKGIDRGLGLIVLYILGGMLFHQLWEASGRYVMRYVLYLLPLSAAGIDMLMKRIGKGND
ncbi:MAG: glycosyltransferase family 39 protein [Lachnospiraceae bacterium]|nr:glycosyltransferase family 39 protein [Lachnospiraceae bacterium]